MPSVGESFKDLIAALLGISTFQPPTQPGPELGDEVTHRVREAMGGSLETIPQVRLRWYPPDVERAQRLASNGDLLLVGQLNESMKLDGVIRGLLDARTSVVNFPRRFYGSKDVIDVLQSRNASDRDVYTEMIPTSESKLMVSDEICCGVSVGEMVPVVGRDFPVLVRRFPQNLYYMWSKNQWYYRSLVGLIPITPGLPDANGNSWVLHMGGGRLAPWNNGLWNTLGRSYINKTQVIFARQAYVTKHAHPARVATAPLGASEEERAGFLSQIIKWSFNAAFSLPVGWDLKLIESKGEGINIYDQAIKNHNEEIATALCGSAVMLQGTAGFSNMDVFRVVQTDLIGTTSGSWDHTVNTQILPGFIGRKWGTDALKNSTRVETDVSAPKDRTVEANTLVTVANAVKGLVEAMAAAQSPDDADHVRLNLIELLARFGVPTEKGPTPEVSTEPDAAASQNPSDPPIPSGT